MCWSHIYKAANLKLFATKYKKQSKINHYNHALTRWLTRTRNSVIFKHRVTLLVGILQRKLDRKLLLRRLRIYVVYL